VDVLNLPDGCAFSPRCDGCMKICLDELPKEYLVGEHHAAACWKNIVEGMEKNAIHTDEEGNITRIDLDREEVR
ncbi:MAG: hypothetical protein J6S47_00075, partial [Eubacteriaceae bacterium]|nr:hypothetical protein [Eubacteriaceae bacterium]